MHLTDARNLRDILRAGIRPSRHEYRASIVPPGWPMRHVFCAPVLPDHESTFHWARELRQRPHRILAIQFRLPDDEKVLVGRFGQDHAVVTAAQAVARFLVLRPDPRGWQVLVPRRIERREILRSRPVPQFIGWRGNPEIRLPPPSDRKPPGVSRWDWERVLNPWLAFPIVEEDPEPWLPDEE